MKSLVRVNSVSPEKKIKVGVLSQSRLLRESIGTLCARHSGLTCLFAVAHFDHSSVSHADVVLLDAHDATESLLFSTLRQAATLRVVVLNADWEGLSIVECARIGVAGFILKDAAPTDIVTAIQVVSRGGRVLPPLIALRFYDQVHRGRLGVHSGGMFDLLTIREREIISLVREGLTNKEIAAKLSIASYTVKNHVHQILQKLECRSRVDLIREHVKHLATT
jgi:two-component system, NarL family, nitrate/nitrite response regulator NarL